MMKILHIVPGLNDPTCGIAVAAKMIARRQGREGHEVVCVDSRRWKWRDVRSADEVWVHSMWTPGVVKAAFVAILMRRRLVRMPHGCLDPVKLAHHWAKKRFAAPVEKWLFNHADAVVSTDKEETEWIRRWLPRYKGEVRFVSLSSQNVFINAEARNRRASGGRDSSEPSRAQASAERRREEDGRLRVLYVGRLTKLKGVRYLLEALPKEAKLVMIGKDEGEEAVCREIALRRGLDVEFRGVVTDEEKEKAYDWCDVLVLPTLSENFGLVVAEALERGKRVITTDGAPAWAPESSASLCGKSGGTVVSTVQEHGQDARATNHAPSAFAKATADSPTANHEPPTTNHEPLIYLRGFRDGTDAQRVALLEDALRKLL